MASVVLPARPRGRRFITNAGALAIGGIAAQAAFLFVEAIIARQIGVQAYGTFAATYTITLLMVLAIDCGMNWKLIEEGSREHDTIALNLGTMLSLKGLMFAAIYPLLLGGLALAGFSATELGLIAIFALFGLLMLAQETFAAAYSAIRTNWLSAVFQATVPLLIALAVAVVVLPAPSLARTAAAYVAGGAIPTAVWAWMVHRRFAPRIDISRFKSVLRGSYLYGITTMLSYSSFKSGVLLLVLLSTSVEVAFFAAAFKLVELGYKIPILLNRVVAPHLFHDSKHRPQEFPALCEGLLHGAATISALTSFVLFVLGAQLIHWIFGGDYRESAGLLQILGIALGLKTFALVAQSVVTSAGQLQFRTRALAVSIAIGTLVSIPLIAAWGARGAAVGVLVTDAIMVSTMLWTLRSLVPGLHVLRTVLLPSAVVSATLGLMSWLQVPAAYALPAGALLIVFALFGTGYLQPVWRLQSPRRPAGAHGPSGGSTQM